MLIAQLEPPHTTRGGDWFYRTYSPGIALAEHEGVFVVDAINIHRHRNTLLERADVLIVNMVCDPDLLPVLAERKRRGQLTVYEANDDVACIQPWNPTSAFYQNPDNQLLFRLLIRECDAVQFTCGELERIYGGLSQTRRVFPNQLDRLPESKPSDDSERKPVVVGWGGSAGHYLDIEGVAGALVEWASTRDDVAIHLMCAPRIASLFGRLEKPKLRVFPTGSIDAYHGFVDGLDIGIAPLEDTGFNRCRSDVKFLEYALHGAVAVVRDLAPYRGSVRDGETGFLFESAEQMRSTLDRLVDAPALRQQVAAAARAYVARDRLEANHSKERLEFYRSLVGTGIGDGSRGLFEELAMLEGARRQGRHLSLEPTRYEHLVHDALVLGQKPDGRKRAVKMLREAIRLEPHSYQPHLFGYAVAPDAAAWLDRAIAQNPKSVAARLALSGLLAHAGKVPSALEQLLGAAEAYPGYDLPYRRLGELLVGLGQVDAAQEFLATAEHIREPCRRLVVS